MTDPITPQNHTASKTQLDTWRIIEILILGTTYPAYSTKYKELVCTGAIDEDGRMIRIHPVPKRYLDDDQAFKNFQRIRVRIQPNRDDPRPDTMRVDFESIEPLEEISAKDHEARRGFVERSPNLVRSVEELEDLNKRFGVSLGAVMPKTIDRIHIRKRNDSERAEWHATERKLLSQTTLPNIRPPKPLDFPEAEFRITWHCDDPSCTGHTSGLKSWPIHELYRKLRNDPDRDAKTEAQLRKMLDLQTRDVFMFMGTFHNHQRTFGLMDVYSPPKRVATPQLDLFAAKR